MCEDDAAIIATAELLSLKPIIYAANLDEAGFSDYQNNPTIKLVADLAAAGGPKVIPRVRQAGGGDRRAGDALPLPRRAGDRSGAGSFRRGHPAVRCHLFASMSKNPSSPRFLSPHGFSGPQPHRRRAGEIPSLSSACPCRDEGASLAPFFPRAILRAALLWNRVKKENDLNQGKWIGIGGRSSRTGRAPGLHVPGEVNEGDRTHPSGIPLSGAGHFCLRPLAPGTCICSPSTALPEP